MSDLTSPDQQGKPVNTDIGERAMSEIGSIEMNQYLTFKLDEEVFGPVLAITKVILQHLDTSTIRTS